jgi:antitoxin component YwqK of YwqJK toxin-antitoxin module
MIRLSSASLGILLVCLLAAPARASTPALMREKVGKLKPKPKPEQLIRWVVEKYADGKVKKRTPYKGDVIHGVVEEYYSNGKLKSKTPYLEGVLEGTAEAYLSSGRRDSKTPYKAGAIHGVLEKYWDTHSNVIMSRTTYANGLRQGEATGWHHNGNILNRRNYKDDRPEGEDLQYHPANANKVKVQRYWSNGELNGAEARYDSHGRQLSEIPWKDGKKHGLLYVFGFNREIRKQEQWETGALKWRKEFEYFHLAGGEKKLKQVESFNNALKLHGKCEYYRAVDVREKTLHYADGQLHGTCQFFDEEGKLARTEKWVNGKKIPTARPGIDRKTRTMRK